MGNARASRRDQRLEPQRDPLLVDGRERVYEEKVTNRKALQGAIDFCDEGDVLVARLDRLGRSIRSLGDLVGELEGTRDFRSLRPTFRCQSLP